MNKAQLYINESRGYSNAEGLGLSDLQVRLDALLIKQGELVLFIEELAQKISVLKVSISTASNVSGSFGQQSPKEKLRTELFQTESHLSATKSTKSKVDSDVNIVQSSLNAYKDSPVHEQEQIVANTMSQLSTTQDELASSKASTKKILLIGGIALVVIVGGYFMFIKKK